MKDKIVFDSKIPRISLLGMFFAEKFEKNKQTITSKTNKQTNLNGTDPGEYTSHRGQPGAWAVEPVRLRTTLELIGEILITSDIFC